MTLKSNYKRKIVLVISILVIFIVLNISGKSKEVKPEADLPLFDKDTDDTIVDTVNTEPDTRFFNDTNNPLDGCYHVYLDVGTNVGIQASLSFIRK